MQFAVTGGGALPPANYPRNRNASDFNTALVRKRSRFALSRRARRGNGGPAGKQEAGSLALPAPFIAHVDVDALSCFPLHIFSADPRTCPEPV